MAYTEADSHYKVWVLFSFADRCGANHSRTSFSKAFRGTPNLVSLPHSILSDVDGVLELAARLPLLLGLFSYSLAFVFSGEMAFAYFLRHAPSGFSVNNGGNLDAILCFTLLVAALGSGWMSLIALLMNHRPRVGIMSKHLSQSLQVAQFWPQTCGVGEMAIRSRSI